MQGRHPAVDGAQAQVVALMPWVTTVWRPPQNQRQQDGLYPRQESDRILGGDPVIGDYLTGQLQMSKPGLEDP